MIEVVALMIGDIRQAALAAVMIAYDFGEGLGRLACISFGCCYGVTLLEALPLLKRAFDHWHFVFSDDMKKISYASGLAGKQVIQIQAITCLHYIGVGLVATLLFLKGSYAAGFRLWYDSNSGLANPVRSFACRLPGRQKNHCLPSHGHPGDRFLFGANDPFANRPRPVPLNWQRA